MKLPSGYFPADQIKMMLPSTRLGISEPGCSKGATTTFTDARPEVDYRPMGTWEYGNGKYVVNNLPKYDSVVAQNLTGKNADGEHTAIGMAWSSEYGVNEPRCVSADVLKSNKTGDRLRGRNQGTDGVGVWTGWYGDHATGKANVETGNTNPVPLYNREDGTTKGWTNTNYPSTQPPLNYVPRAIVPGQTGLMCGNLAGTSSTTTSISTATEAQCLLATELQKVDDSYFSTSGLVPTLEFEQATPARYRNTAFGSALCGIRRYVLNILNMCGFDWPQCPGNIVPDYAYNDGITTSGVEGYLYPTFGETKKDYGKYGTEGKDNYKSAHRSNMILNDKHPAGVSKCTYNPDIIVNDDGGRHSAGIIASNWATKQTNTGKPVFEETMAKVLEYGYTNAGLVKDSFKITVAKSMANKDVGLYNAVSTGTNLTPQIPEDLAYRYLFNYCTQKGQSGTYVRITGGTKTHDGIQTSGPTASGNFSRFSDIRSPTCGTWLQTLNKRTSNAAQKLASPPVKGDEAKREAAEATYGKLKSQIDKIGRKVCCGKDATGRCGPECACWRNLTSSCSDTEGNTACPLTPEDAVYSTVMGSSENNYPGGGTGIASDQAACWFAPCQINSGRIVPAQTLKVPVSSTGCTQNICQNSVINWSSSPIPKGAINQNIVCSDGKTYSSGGTTKHIPVWVIPVAVAGGGITLLIVIVAVVHRFRIRSKIG